MYKNISVSLVIPAYNEEKLIEDTLLGVPPFVDKIYVIDDGSTDNMAKIVSDFPDERVNLIRHKKNEGVGAAIINGYKKSASDGYDATVVIGGDNQMDLSDLPNLLNPIVNGDADYVKGNRFLYSNLNSMPLKRLFGNVILSFMTRLASGYWSINDTQDGYTVITKKAIKSIDWDKAWKKYGYVSDFLVRFNVYNFRVKDVPRKPVYLKGERQSQIKIGKYMADIIPMLMKGFLWRLWKKYIKRGNF